MRSLVAWGSMTLLRPSLLGASLPAPRAAWAAATALQAQGTAGAQVLTLGPTTPSALSQNGTVQAVLAGDFVSYAAAPTFEYSYLMIPQYNGRAPRHQQAGCSHPCSMRMQEHGWGALQGPPVGGGGAAQLRVVAAGGGCHARQPA